MSEVLRPPGMTCIFEIQIRSETNEPSCVPSYRKRTCFLSVQEQVPSLRLALPIPVAIGMCADRLASKTHLTAREVLGPLTPKSCSPSPESIPLPALPRSRQVFLSTFFFFAVQLTDTPTKPSNCLPLRTQGGNGQTDKRTNRQMWHRLQSVTKTSRTANGEHATTSENRSVCISTDLCPIRLSNGV